MPNFVSETASREPAYNSSISNKTTIYLIKPQPLVKILLYGKSWKSNLQKFSKKKYTVGDCINSPNSSFHTFPIIFASEIPVLPTKKVKFISLHLDLRFGHVTCNQQKQTEMMVCQLQAYIFKVL